MCMKGFGPLKIIVDIIMIITAFYMLSRGLAGEMVQPFVLVLASIIMLAEQFTDMFHAY